MDAPLDFHGKEITPHCIVVYCTLENRRVPCLEEGEVLSIRRMLNHNNSGQWTIVVQKVMKRPDIFSGMPGPKVTARLFFPDRMLVQEETATQFWKRMYGELPEPLSDDEIMNAIGTSVLENRRTH